MYSSFTQLDVRLEMDIIFLFLRYWELYHYWDMCNVFVFDGNRIQLRILIWSVCLAYQQFNMSHYYVAVIPLKCGTIVVFFTIINTIACFLKETCIMKKGKMNEIQHQKQYCVIWYGCLLEAESLVLNFYILYFQLLRVEPQVCSLS